ncbi:type VII secretion integral membrane protein EccD [Paractinoplanes tereljensis]|uniref:type VII secretion integral membrane protein EccD n=1 Tax=Paractinoplanes tereljensis TaxID=571912 RepID=UPI001945A314|nr:type VII secretion integral membrane protein EccD [Actinoplanes tereljensis]
MTVVNTGETCRLVVCGPDRQIELAVPAGVVLADLLPALLHHLGEDLADTGLAHGGWVLQRLGESPLDEDSSVTDLGLRDGDTVHLRPRSEQIPPVSFDDLIDGIAAGSRSRSGLWRPEMGHWAAWAALALLLPVGLVAVALPGPELPRAITAAVAAVICVIGAAAAGRMAGERQAAAIIAVAGIGFGALAGLILPGSFGGPALFAASVTAGAVAVVTAAAVGWGGPVVAGFLASVLLIAGGAAVEAFTGLSAPGLVAVAGTLLAVMVPLTAFRLAGQRLTPLPTQPEHLQQDIDPEPSEQVLHGAARTDRYMTALYAGLAVPVAVSLVLLARESGWAPAALVLVTAAARLTAARTMTSAWHRLAQAVPAAAGLVTLAGYALAAVEWRLLAVPLVLALAVVVIVLGRKVPGRRLMPYWGRVGDILQLLTTVAMVPVLLAVLGVYGFARALGG